MMFSLLRVPQNESLYRGYCPTKAKTITTDTYCNCKEGHVEECGKGLDYQACEEIEKRKKGKSKKKRGNDL